VAGDIYDADDIAPKGMRYLVKEWDDPPQVDLPKNFRYNNPVGRNKYNVLLYRFFIGYWI